MNLKKRIIARIDIKGPNVVKGINLEGLRVLGNPQYFSEIYYKAGADEIIYHDVVASLYQRKYLLDIISKTSQNCFIPLSVGGGVKNLKDIETILKNGADKVYLNSAAITNPKIIDQASKVFGSSTIGISLEVISNDKQFSLMYNYGREKSSKNLFDWISEAQDRGAGELQVTSINYEGRSEGMDLNLYNKIEKFIKVPMIYHGGVGSKEHILKLINQKKISGIVISSFFHYHEIKKKNYKFSLSDEGNFTFLQDNDFLKQVKTNSIRDVKNFLKRKKVNIRC